MATPAWSHLLEPTPIDPTRVVAVPSVPLASSLLYEIVGESFLAAALRSDILLESHNAPFWSATRTIHGPLPLTRALPSGLLEDNVESIAKNNDPHKDKICKRSGKHFALWGAEHGLKFLLSPRDNDESHSKIPPLLNSDCATRRPNACHSPFVGVHCCSSKLSNTKVTSQNRILPLRSMASTENEEKHKSQQTSRPFRLHQSNQWYMRYLDMVAFREEYGHCLVPLNWSGNPSLAHWVKRQRYQYRAKQGNRHSTLTADRQEMLEKLGFVWDSHALGWEERWQALREFKKKYGHCRVPKTYAANPQLAIWVKCQRRQFKLYSEGKNSNMTKARIDKLASLDFDFTPRPRKQQESG